MIDYFIPANTPEEEILRRIKGNYRRLFISQSILEDGLGSIPPAWLKHNISEILKRMLGSRAPNALGGEDLPDLEEGEVEIARLTLANSVHGEVTSLRASRSSDGKEIMLHMCDEYETSYDLPFDQVESPLTDEEVLCLFREAQPCPAETTCEIELQSYFYPDIDALTCVPDRN